MRIQIASTAVAIGVLLGLIGTASAQQWYYGKTSVGQVALDYSRDPMIASKKYTNVELQFPHEMVIGAPERLPSGRAVVPILGLGDKPVHALFPGGEVPEGLGKGYEITMACTAQGYFTADRQATFSPNDGFLTLACGGLKVLSTTFATRAPGKASPSK